jgi:hypothetical protein
VIIFYLSDFIKRNSKGKGSPERWCHLGLVRGSGKCGEINRLR